MATRKSWDRGSGLKVKVDNLPELRQSIGLLLAHEVLVGFPEDTTERKDPESMAGGITNASLGYIHDNGAPEANVPARPFMIPGITSVLPTITNTLVRMAEFGLSGRPNKIQEGNERIGLMAVGAIQAYITAGIGPPLADYTVAQRAKKGRKGAQAEQNRRAAGYGASAPGAGLVTPLIDTAEMLKSLNYVVRLRAARPRSAGGFRSFSAIYGILKG